MQVLIASATNKETTALREQFSGIRNIHFIETGVGLLNSCFSLSEITSQHHVDLVIQVGIAGCFDESIPLGNCFVVKDETVADLGVQEEKYKDIFDLGLADENAFPYSSKQLINPHKDLLQQSGLQPASSVSVNNISTGEQVNIIKNKYRPLLETMEGAAFHYVCLQRNIPFIQFRAVSNYIGVRDKSQWKIAEAVTNSNNAVIQFLASIKL